MKSSVPSEVLRHAREDGNISQAVLAKRMGTVPSVLSKLEKADDAEPELAERYLSSLNTELSHAIQHYYSRDWLQRPPPSFLHPDRENLWLIDQSLNRLEAFEAEKKDPILRGPIDLLKSELRAAEIYLRRRDHTIAWVGDIGVGKTTALSYAVGLLVGDGRSGKRPAFPVGAGRVTVCETAIRVAPTFGVLVDTVEEEEVVRMTRDLVSGLAPGAAGVGVSAEIARLLRNMAKMKISTTIVDDEMTTADPVADLMSNGLTVDEVTDRMVAAMALGARTERQIILPEGSEDGLSWISSLVAEVNAGLEPRFGVPKRITVLMPSKNLNADGQILSIIDTRGVEGVTQRPDLTFHNEDKRTLVVLCSKFADAPNATVQRHLREAVDGDFDAIERHRRCILVLPRGEEALEVPGYDGAVNSREEGYALRKNEVGQALINAELPTLPVYFFDARNDDADKIWSRLRSQVAQMRTAYAQRGLTASQGVRNLIENVDGVRALEARREIEHEISRLIGEVEQIAASVRPAYLNLIEQMSVGHHSSVAASVYRRGGWDNFQFAHILSNGVRIDANLRSQQNANRIEHRLMDFQSKYWDIEDVVHSVQSLRARLADGRQDFLTSARTIGRDAYGELLAREGEVWTESAKRYGQGPGYKNDLASIWRRWFETSAAAHRTSAEISDRVQDAWFVSVLEPLRLATQTTVEG